MNMSEMKLAVIYLYILYLVKFSNSSCVPCKNSIEEYVENALMKEFNIQSIVKRQLKNSTVDAQKMGTQQAVSANTGNSCDCNFEDVISKYILSNIPTAKSQSDSFNARNQTKLRKILLKGSTKSSGETKRAAVPAVSASKINATQLNSGKNESQSIKDVKEVCSHYKDIPELNIDKMADVWQLVYYRAKEKLMCFRIHLKKTSRENRKFYEKIFSNFEETIDWQECLLELTAAATKKEARKHFLQTSEIKNAVLDNIIITIDFDKKKRGESKVVTLEEQTPDQWLVYKNLLLMRDCDNGELMIFSRLPSSPDQLDFEEAMEEFGENGMYDTVECDDGREPEIVQEPYLHIKYDILS